MAKGRYEPSAIHAQGKKMETNSSGPLEVTELVLTRVLE